ncbi:DNA damage-binding protein CMR1 [Zancudomyces culisetae]|uniref:DNA damage-binding protein CMR1 n=1 Tax=Zancudomyces culisetae TaxID=1213189 RepID=A0A1R1PWD9_ZANCU|nr:DNA damage-binding protein CMR1 [Zancudomyces culisetae]|eukprot:OMH85268.1 DNA damage-binding protein CMR1 [Zancudomyces culisetae]
MNKYELERQENIRKNEEILKSLGLFKSSKPAAPQDQKKREQKPAETKIRTRKVVADGNDVAARKKARASGNTVPAKSDRVLRSSVKKEANDQEDNGNLKDKGYKLEYELLEGGRRGAGSGANGRVNNGSLGKVVGLEEEETKYFKFIQIKNEENGGDSGDGSVKIKNEDTGYTFESQEAVRTPTALEKLEREALGEIFSGFSIRHAAKNIQIASDRIYSMAFHPSQENVLVCAGDKVGRLGFWKVNGDDYVSKDWKRIQSRIAGNLDKNGSKKAIKKEKGVDAGDDSDIEAKIETYTDEEHSVIKNEKQETTDEQSDELFDFQPHSEACSNISIPTQNPNMVYTTGYDGSIRQLDLSHPTGFVELLSLADDPMIVCMDLQFKGQQRGNSPLVWFSTVSGVCGYVDPRKQNHAVTHQFHEKRIGCVSVHPTDSNIVATSSNDRSIKIWDVRNMIKPTFTDATSPPQPTLLDEAGEVNSITSVYFSPDGSQLLSTSFNNTVAVWSWDSAQKSITDKQSRYHNNRTGRWVTMLRARWHPSPLFPRCFVVGNMDHRVDVFSGRSLDSVVSLYDRKDVTTVPAVCVFHPELSIIAAGNASGKINIWS